MTTQILDRVTRVTPLGLRFWDAATNTCVGSGLRVTAYPADQPLQRAQAISNRLGTYLLQNLPGLRQVEHGLGDADFWRDPPTRSFVIEVVDSERRFQPFQFNAKAPSRNLFEVDCLTASPPTSPPGASVAVVPMHSAPTRPLPSGMAVIRAELRTPADAPAAWAVMEARFDGELMARSFADEAGRIALMFPYPEPPTPLPDVSPVSPPLGERSPLTSQRWPIELSARYSSTATVPKIPDLCQVLAQASAQLIGALPATPLSEVSIEFGKELVARTTAKSTLIIV